MHELTNPQVQLFRWVEKDDGVQELQAECGYHGHILALHMQARILHYHLNEEHEPRSYYVLSI